MALLIDSNLLGPLILAILALGLTAIGGGSATQVLRVWSVAAGGRGASLRLGPYTLVDKIGEGAMGQVYRAWSAARGAWCAVKLLPAGAGPRERQRFEKEARLAAELHHPNTVSIYDRGEGRDGTCYYAMELVDGITLEQLVQREGRQRPERVVAILLQLCAALEEAHAKGLVHRDIKPDNVLLTGERLEHVKLIDFGLVERVSEVGRSEAPDAVVGTPLYISPEAIVAPETVGAQSDLYGLGAVAYFLLRGAPVFQGNSVVEVCGHHLHTTPESLSRVLGDAIPPALERIVMDCLSKDAAQRPGGAAELARRLSTCLGREESRRVARGTGAASYRSAAVCPLRRRVEGGLPSSRVNERRMRSASPKPARSATLCKDCPPASISARAASTRRRSTALAGVTPVSAA